MTISKNEPDIGVVIPTLGKRKEYLVECLNSLEDPRISILVIGPESVFSMLRNQILPQFSFLAERTNSSLPDSITYAISHMPSSVRYVTWIGDDDLLCVHEVLKAREVLENQPKLSLVYGDCDYIDSDGFTLWTNRPGTAGSRLIKFLPQRISQPATVIRREHWDKVGGLDHRFQLAFDFDLFIRLQEVGSFTYHPGTLAKYRWHKDALSSRQRLQSVIEAFKVRTEHKSALVKVLGYLIEPGLVIATYFFPIYLFIISLRWRKRA